MGVNKRNLDAADILDTTLMDSNSNIQNDFPQIDPASNGLNLQWQEVYTEILGSDNQESNVFDALFHMDHSDASLDPWMPEVLPGIADVTLSIDNWVKYRLPPRSETDTAKARTCSHSVSYRFQPPSTNVKCFGMIYSTPARLIGNMQDLRSKLMLLKPDRSTFSTKLELSDQFCFLAFDDGIQIGQLNDLLARALFELSSINSVYLEVFANVEDTVQRIKTARRQHDAVIKVDVNVYGDTRSRDQVGQTLSKHKVYLQHTLHRATEFEYDNPHMLIFDDIEYEQNVTVPVDEALGKPDLPSTQDVILDVCRSETQDRGFVGVQSVTGLKSKLLRHQEQALEFMTQRETGPIPPEFQLWQPDCEEGVSRYQHKITGSWASVAPIEIGGGILADDMGMGKTLSALSLITNRSVEAWEWSSVMTKGIHDKLDGDKLSYSRATLIVVSSVLIMNEWYKEIDGRLDDSLKIVKYHGKGRRKEPMALIDCDIVLTTYHTLAIEQKEKRCPLKPIKWFRIVLDEAHTIKRQATTFFAAVSELEACHRWCLTGTPIQNSLVDLGSLVSFLRLNPLDKPAMFRKHIIAPFADDRNEAITSLKLLLNSVCLRRSIQRLHLPQMDEVVQYIDLTSAERTQYEQTIEHMTYAISHGSRERYCDTPFGKFQIQLQLRILCNHGTFQQVSKYGQKDLQTQREDAVCSMGADAGIRCTRCDEIVPTLTTNYAADVGQNWNKNILCDECYLSMPGTPIHAGPGLNSTQSSSVDWKEYDDPHGPAPTFTLACSHANFDHKGQSTKMTALMSDVKTGLLLTKSIIFSCWTKTLNLVALHLVKDGIEYARIDGDTEIGRRQVVLDEFASHKEVRVLLMTTGTGAYGLNLAIANRVFILEPQWNPSVENQAVARVHRYPQTQKVQVVRYVVRRTVEEDIRKQQTGKANLAASGFD